MSDFFHYLQILEIFNRYCRNAGIGRQRLAVMIKSEKLPFQRLIS